MTTRRPTTPPTPEQIGAGGPPPEISIISERAIPTMPTPGVEVVQIAVTYRIAPNPPQVIFVPLEQLPNWVFQRDHPGQPVPPAVQRAGDDALRSIIKARQRPAPSAPRMI